MAKGTRAKLKRLYQNTYELLTEKWIEAQDGEVSPLQRFGIFWVLVFKSFGRNRCPLRATALAYTTLLALVPLLAVVLSITSSLLQERGEAATKQMIERFVDAAVPQLKLLPPEPVATTNAPGSGVSATVPETGTPEAEAERDAPAAADSEAPLKEVVNYIYSFIANVKVKTLGATGVVSLIMIAIMLLSTIEGTFNDIWGVTHGRSWPRRIVQYWAAISLGPIVLALAVVLAGNTYSQSARIWIENLPLIGQFAFRALPFVYVSIAFALFYKLMPNTSVHWRAAAVGGLVGGSLWLFLNLFNTFFLTRVINWSKIYGTALAVLPIFLLGLYFSWLIMLFGAQVAYAFQNRTVYIQEKRAESVGQRAREYIALRVMAFLARRFECGQPPPTVLDTATELGVPSRLVGRVLQPLMNEHLVHEVALEKDQGYAPARPIESITCCDVLASLRGGIGTELQTRDDGTREVVCSEFDRIQEAEHRAAQVSLKELLDRLGGAELRREQITRGMVEALDHR